MGKRYFCDYCQRSFVDDIDSRKKHLNGVSHLRLKKEYYANNRDLPTLIKEERSKEICRRFRQTGSCPFGFICNYTHYTPEELAYFDKIVDEANQKRTEFLDMDEWLSKRARGDVAMPTIQTNVSEVYLSNVSSLPPSLHSLTIEQMQNAHTTEWG